MLGSGSVLIGTEGWDVRVSATGEGEPEPEGDDDGERDS